MNEQEQLIWAAGFFDGEGCIYIHKRANGDYKETIGFGFRISCSQIEVEPLEIFTSLFGGNIHTSSSGRIRMIYTWQMGSAEAALALNEMTPYLIVKKTQADIALNFQLRRVQMPKSEERDILDSNDYELLRSLKKDSGEVVALVV